MSPSNVFKLNFLKPVTKNQIVIKRGLKNLIRCTIWMF